jgi:hypothetical protein
MKKLILLTLLLMLSINTLSFAQETEKPKKERNWIVGIGWRPTTYEGNGSQRTTTKHYNATIGYKGFTVSYYRIPIETVEFSSSQYLPDLLVLGVVRNYITVGYQHVFSKKSNAEVKPIVGFEYGFSSYFVNTGIRYKRSQILLSMGYYNAEYYDNGRLMAVIPFYEVFTGGSYNLPSITLKYQFLF